MKSINEKTTIPCAHPKLEAVIPSQGECFKRGWFVTDAKKKVQMCAEGCGYSETLRMISFGTLVGKQETT